MLRTIIVELEAPMSGMTLFGKKAFVLGKESFASGEELAKPYYMSCID